jgi:hypothetical protein
MSTTTVIAVAGVIVAIAAFAISAWVAVTARRDLTLTAYSNAIQGGILDLKRTFAEHPEIFHRQMEMNPAIRDLIPDYMRGEKNIPTFLAFAGGLWRLSYVYSVMIRGSRLGLRRGEREGLLGEMELWLIGVPGFYHVYKSQVCPLADHGMLAHNPEFKKYLDKVYSSEKFLVELKKRAEYDPLSPTCDSAVIGEALDLSVPRPASEIASDEAVGKHVARGSHVE